MINDTTALGWELLVHQLREDSLVLLDSSPAIPSWGLTVRFFWRWRVVVIECKLHAAAVITFICHHVCDVSELIESALLTLLVGRFFSNLLLWDSCE